MWTKSSAIFAREKERCRAIVSVLPYSVLPKMVIIHLVCYVYIFLNCEINPVGISESLYPREIILRHRLDWTRHCCGMAGVPLGFGQYVEANLDPNVTNNMVSRTFVAVYLGPTGNIQGTKKVFELITGAVKKSGW